ncbi:MAG: hypothetical protein QNK23_13645 [Crocinitomicaceae bacterium]|nr:hypothetical protein [Crocinitomicaceae bacterium]
MDIREKILEIREGRNFAEFQTYFSNNPKEVKKLVQIITNQEPYPLEEYASWILVHLCKTQQAQVQPYYNDIVDAAFLSENQSVMRNTINIIYHLDITEYRESDFIDLLIGFIQSYQNKVAVQVYSMFVLINFIKKHPELKPEIMEIIDLHADGKSAAYASARRKFIKKMRVF